MITAEGIHKVHRAEGVLASEELADVRQFATWREWQEVSGTRCRGPAGQLPPASCIGGVSVLDYERIETSIGDGCSEAQMRGVQ